MDEPTSAIDPIEEKQIYGRNAVDTGGLKSAIISVYRLIDPAARVMRTSVCHDQSVSFEPVYRI